jgi:hypothetical protein
MILHLRTRAPAAQTEVDAASEGVTKSESPIKNRDEDVRYVVKSAWKIAARTVDASHSRTTMRRTIHCFHRGFHNGERQFASILHGVRRFTGRAFDQRGEYDAAAVAFGVESAEQRRRDLARARPCAAPRPADLPPADPPRAQPAASRRGKIDKPIGRLAFRIR